MYKTYTFEVEIYDQQNNVVDKRVEHWQDKSESLAKDYLRLSLQRDIREGEGYWPRVELYCLNGDVRSYKEDQ